MAEQQRQLNPDPSKWTILDLTLMTDEQKEQFYAILDDLEEQAFSGGPVIAASSNPPSPKTA